MGWRKDSTSSFAGKVRAAAKVLGAGGVELSAVHLSHAVGVQTYRDNRRLHWVIKDMKKAGELVSVRTGVYRLGGVGANSRSPLLGLEREERRTRNRPPAPKHEVMWRFLRMRRFVTVGDLQEVADASEKYAKEWLRMLNRRGIVRKLKGGHWQLMVDQIESPQDIEKAEKLRALRAKQRREAIVAIQNAKLAADRVTDQVIALMTAIDQAGVIMAELDRSETGGRAHPASNKEEDGSCGN